MEGGSENIRIRTGGSLFYECFFSHKILAFLSDGYPYQKTLTLPNPYCRFCLLWLAITWADWSVGGWSQKTLIRTLWEKNLMRLVQQCSLQKLKTKLIWITNRYLPRPCYPGLNFLFGGQNLWKNLAVDKNFPSTFWCHLPTDWNFPGQERVEKWWK